MRPTFRTSRHNIFNLTHPEHSLALMAVLARTSGGYAEGKLVEPKKVSIALGRKPRPFVHPVVLETKEDPDYQSILTHIRAAGQRLETIKRFDMPGFMPRYEYLREMKRYGVLPEDFDPKNPSPVDPYQLDLKYFELFYPRRHPERSTRTDERRPRDKEVILVHESLRDQQQIAKATISRHQTDHGGARSPRADSCVGSI